MDNLLLAAQVILVLFSFFKLLVKYVNKLFINSTFGVVIFLKHLFYLTLYNLTPLNHCNIFL